MALFGVAGDAVAEWCGSANEPALFEVWPENEKALDVFLSMSTQWRWSGGMQSQRVGLDFTTFELELKSAGIKSKQAHTIFGDIKRMERAALKVWRDSPIQTT
ncbi:MAG: DUF1799 domain-containing protein [Pseudomonadota bacterium]